MRQRAGAEAQEVPPEREEELLSCAIAQKGCGVSLDGGTQEPSGRGAVAWVTLLEQGGWTQ